LPRAPCAPISPSTGLAFQFAAISVPQLHALHVSRRRPQAARPFFRHCSSQKTDRHPRQSAQPRAFLVRSCPIAVQRESCATRVVSSRSDATRGRLIGRSKSTSSRAAILRRGKAMRTCRTRLCTWLEGNVGGTTLPCVNGGARRRAAQHSRCDSANTSMARALRNT